MIFIVAAAIYGIIRCRFAGYWKWVIAAFAWSAGSGLLVPAYGTLEDPTGDGFLTHYVRVVTSDGPMMGLYAIVILVITYGGLIYFLLQAWNVAKVYKATVEAGEAREVADDVGTGRKALEISGIIVGAILLYLVVGAILTAASKPQVPIVAVNTPQADRSALALAAAVVEINEKPPVVIDQWTKMTHATSEGRTLTYHYEITKRFQSDAAFLANAKVKTIPGVCGNTDMRSDMDQLGVTYRYSYKFPDEPDEASMIVNTAACRP